MNSEWSSLVVINATFYCVKFVNRLRMMTSLNTATQLMFLEDVMMTITMYVMYDIHDFSIGCK